MSQDYNIYIRNMTGSGDSGNKPTQPKPVGTPNATQAKVTTETITESIGFQVPTAAKIVAAAVVAYKTYEKVINVLTPFISAESGDYRFQIEHSNFFQAVSNLTNPIGTGMHALKYYQDLMLDRRAKEQQRMLFGDAIINKNGGTM